MTDHQTNTQVVVAFFDIDGTLYRDNFSAVLMEYLHIKEKIDPVHYQGLENAFSMWRARKGTYDEVNNELIKSINNGLEGVLLSDVITASKYVATQGLERPYKFTHALLEALKILQPRPLLIAISGSPLCVVEPYAQALGFDEVYATEFEVDDGRIRGGFERAASPYHSKGLVCQGIASKHGFERIGECIRGAIAVGDARADERMLSVVEFPLAFNPNAELMALCRRQGMPAIIERKDVILALMTHWPDELGAFEEVPIDDILPRDLANLLQQSLPGIFAH
ncbi:MAG: HAD-IB family phosphatase [Candidatus Nomurabacteria bacterium]|nr:MAG: HAD-IB family phosphatase [Candidatus Nomurabacteria bacterium]